MKRISFRSKKTLWLVIALLLAGCSVIARKQLFDLYGPEKVQSRVVPANELSPELIKEWADAKGVFDRRCVVCHSCYDSPCQLKLSSFEGIDRGASKVVVQDGARLSAVEPTRLFLDGHDTAEWRTKGFFPVLNEREQTSEANLRAGVMYRLLDLKRKNPLPEVSVLPGGILPNTFDFSVGREQRCPSIAELDLYEKTVPLWGMPFGLPGLPDQEFNALKTWLSHGARAPQPQALPTSLQTAVAKWEGFFNGTSLKEQLMARYLYEHLFLGDMYFNEVDNTHSFRIVRSSTPPGMEIAVISTRRATDDPGTKKKVYYRFMLSTETPVAKTQIPYFLNKQRMERYRELFLTPSYAVNEFPSYDPKLATNPFKTYEAIPLHSRYQFLLDEAQFFIMGFIKGPVCSGQVALNVIEDRFWVFFVNPDKDQLSKYGNFLSEQSENLTLPAEAGSDPSAIAKWRRYSQGQKKYLEAKREYLRSVVNAKGALTLDAIWAGEQKNSNAALTVFRHFDSATVVRGLVGSNPKNAWVIGYSLLERMHYLLVAEFDVFGSVGHGLLTRLYMDFLRAEGENNFLVFLPQEIREAEHNSWYRGIGSNNHEYTLSSDNFDWAESAIKYKSNNPKAEFFELAKTHMGQVLDRSYELPKIRSSGSPGTALERISRLQGKSASFLAETSLIRLRKKDGSDQVYTLLLNRAHSNVAVLYLEKFRLIPEEDNVTLVPGFIGAYPNIFFVVEETDLDSFANKLETLQSEDDYRELLDIFAVRRTNSQFWQNSDWFQAEYRKSLGSDKREVLDYNRFENR